jgi:hypothetical protein
MAVIAGARWGRSEAPSGAFAGVTAVLSSVSKKRPVYRQIDYVEISGSADGEVPEHRNDTFGYQR